MSAWRMQARAFRRRNPAPWHGVKAAKHNLRNEETFERRTPGRTMPPERQPISDRSPDRVAGVRAQPSRRIDIMRSGLYRMRG
jgi:hypothetical protein